MSGLILSHVSTKLHKQLYVDVHVYRCTCRKWRRRAEVEPPRKARKINRRGHNCVLHHAHKYLDACSRCRAQTKLYHAGHIANAKYQGKGTKESPYIVDWLPGDVEDPMKWSDLRKWSLTLFVSIATLAVAFCSSAYSGGAREILLEFKTGTIEFILGVSLFVLGFALGPLLWAPLSEIFGRRLLFLITYAALTAFNAGAAGAQNIETLLILRFFAGSFGSSPLTNSGGTLADMFPAKTRGLAMVLFAAAPFLGPAIGPIVGGFVGQTIGWRWIEGVMAIFTGFILILGYLVLPETYAPVLLRQRAKLLSKTERAEYVSKFEAQKRLNYVDLFKTSLGRPWVLLFLEPIVLLLSIYMAIVYGILYMLFAAFPIVFQQGRGWSPGIGGLAFLGIIGGMVCTVAYCVFIENPRYTKAVDRNNGRAPPEERLPTAIIGAFLLPIGLFWFSWTNYPSIHWIVPILAGAPFGAGMVFVFLAIMNYLVDTYVIYAASVLAANSVLRSLFGMAFPLFTSNMYKTLGIHWASSIAAFLSLVCIPAPIVFYLYGARIRAASKYATEAEAFIIKMMEAARKAREPPSQIKDEAGGVTEEEEMTELSKSVVINVREKESGSANCRFSSSSGRNMPRLIDPVHWSIIDQASEDTTQPFISFQSRAGNRFHIHPVDDELVRIVHVPPKDKNAPFSLRVISWEERRSKWSVTIINPKSIQLSNTTSAIDIHVDISHSLSLTWSRNGITFLKDFKMAYSHDIRTGRMYHRIFRDSYITTDEHQKTVNHNHPHPPSQVEFVYGLGETKGGLMKGGKRYTIDSRDSLGYDPEETDPLYKICPFYTIHDSQKNTWTGLYYNTLVPSIIDLGAEHDFSTGNFRSYTVENGPLDYYVLAPRGGLPDVISQFARLVTPHSTGPMGSPKDGWQTSPTLPNLSQFGYLASSLTLSERKDAQTAVSEYIVETRQHGFPVDGMHLSSGYCVDEKSQERNYFVWNREKYPDPSEMGRKMEEEMSCQLIINVKPWLLDGHPWYTSTSTQRAFVRSPPDALDDSDRCGHNGEAKTIHWSANMGETAKGSYIDFSSTEGDQAWRGFLREGVMRHHITGVWIDNNEFSTLYDDCVSLRGQVNPWMEPTNTTETEVSGRMGWRGDIAVGAVGRQVLTMGMARSTFTELLLHSPGIRPTVVTRSAVPGIQAYAHGTWSGDNSTTWETLRYSTKMSLSVGVSFGPGLYGHDIGGFSGTNSPSAELLIRWCQQSAWHTRFTVHSWKKISTTLFMFEGEQPETTEILRKTIEWRYLLLPSLYSLYVTEYHRKGHPVLKPLLWYHSVEHQTLTQDEQFLFGSHVLVAPVLTFQSRDITFYLPCGQWCELDTGKWFESTGETITMAAPLSRCPTLVRAGGILVLGGVCQTHAFDRAGRTERTVLLFPGPSGGEGEFTLVEDDGRTNDAGFRGVFSEISIRFEADASEVRVEMETKRGDYKGQWDYHFKLPDGDTRTIRGVEEKM
ncbi:polyamine transporter 3, partial [Planoprotostelium fungivorum]